VWLGSEDSPRKIASIGIAVRRWVIWHGHAVNLVNDLQPFHLISPCGFQPEVMTRLVDWVEPSRASRSEFEQHFAAGWLDRTGAGDAPRILSMSLENARREVELAAAGLSD
jgi:lipoate-protein ligase B